MKKDKAFIFDLDGVIINDEPMWQIAKKEIFIRLFGEEIYKKLGNTVGLNRTIIHEKAVAMGSTATIEELFSAFEEKAHGIYQNAPLTPGLKRLSDILVHLRYRIGVVSASPKNWVDTVLERITFKESVEVVVSLSERKDLAHKPSPDGYHEAMRLLQVASFDTVVLEDSNAGIESAKKAGAYVIGLTQNLVDGYRQTGADAYAQNLDEVIHLLAEKTST